MHQSAHAARAADGAEAPAEGAAGVKPLAGFTVGVTAARRAEELGALLERRGAEVLHAPALRIVPLADDTELRTATGEVLAQRPDIVIVTTAVGFRGWLDTAAGWDLGERLTACLAEAEILARGPKARGAVRAAGLREAWSPASESMAEVLERLLAQGVEGKRIVTQLHGEPLPGFTESLRTAGAEVTGVPVYRWLPPEDLAPVDRLVDATVAGDVDALTFTSAPAAASLLRRAGERGLQDELLGALRTGTVAACVGSVTAAPLQEQDVPALMPERSRIGPLVQVLCSELPARAHRLTVAGHDLRLRGHAVLVDGALRLVPQDGMLLLRALARRPGRVVSRAGLLRALPGSGAGEDAVGAAVDRLRHALGAPDLIRTVAERGYRLGPGPEPDDEQAGA